MNSQRISAKILFSLLLLTFLMLPGCRLTIYSISGKVSGDVSAGVTITIALSGFGSAKTTTDANGNYTFRFLANGNYTVTPSCAGYTFTPVNSTVTVKGKSITNVNFVSTRFGYTVSFDSQGATIEANPTTIKVIPPATTVGTLPEPPTRTGYIFAGWYTAPNGGGTAFTADTPVTADLTVYAKWELLICIRLNSSTSK